jgi:hypothetical protein
MLLKYHITPYVKIIKKLLMHYKLFIGEYAKKCIVAEYKHQVFLFSLMLTSSYKNHKMR